MKKQLKLVGVMLLLLGLMSGPAFAMLPYLHVAVPPGATKQFAATGRSGGGGAERQTFLTVLEGVSPEILEEYYMEEMQQVSWMPVQQGATSMVRWIEWQRTRSIPEVAFMFILPDIQQGQYWVAVDAVRTEGTLSSNLAGISHSSFDSNWRRELAAIIPDLNPNAPVVHGGRSASTSHYRSNWYTFTDEHPVNLQQRFRMQLLEKGWTEEASYGDPTIAWSIWRHEIDGIPLQALLYVGVLPTERGRVYSLVISSPEFSRLTSPDVRWTYVDNRDE